MLVLLVGNKNDLQAGVDLVCVEEFAFKNNMEFFSCSAETGEGVKPVVESCAKEFVATEGVQLGSERKEGRCYI